jgi:hypothetical protein
MEDPELTAICSRHDSRLEPSTSPLRCFELGVAIAILKGRLFLFLNGVKQHLPIELLYFTLHRFVGLDARCSKHTLFFKMTPPLIYYTGLYKNKMVKYASVHDRVRLVSDFLYF